MSVSVIVCERERQKWGGEVGWKEGRDCCKYIVCQRREHMNELVSTCIAYIM